MKIQQFSYLSSKIREASIVKSNKHHKKVWKKIRTMEPKRPTLITGKDEMRKWSRSMRFFNGNNTTVALIPTMGYLHKGHLSLVEEARNYANLIVVSIYVNPGQFSPSEDLSTYPSDFHGDIEKLMTVNGGVDVVFHPRNLYDYDETTNKGDIETLNGEIDGKVLSCVEDKGFGHETWVRVEKLEKGLCGNSRPVFFRGVATIVSKLFNIVEPDIALFGKKDYQQWRLIQRMVRDLDMPVKVIGSEIVRDADGLALSSRNVHLSPAEREKALSISRSLLRAKSSAKTGQTNCTELRNAVIEAITNAGGRVDYAEIVERESLMAVDQEIKKPVVLCIAAWFGNVRLIDNMELDV